MVRANHWQSGGIACLVMAAPGSVKVGMFDQRRIARPKTHPARSAPPKAAWVELFGSVCGALLRTADPHRYMAMSGLRAARRLNTPSVAIDILRPESETCNSFTKLHATGGKDQHGGFS